MSNLHRRLPLSHIMQKWRVGSYDATGWTWEDEANELYSRKCAYHGVEGCYVRAMEHFITATRDVPEPILLGPDGRVWDGHHRIVAAWRYGLLSTLPVAFGTERTEP